MTQQLARPQTTLNSQKVMLLLSIAFCLLLLGCKAEVISERTSDWVSVNISEKKMNSLKKTIFDDQKLNQFRGGALEVIFQGKADSFVVLHKNKLPEDVLNRLSEKVAGDKILVVRVAVKDYSPHTHIGGVGYIFLNELGTRILDKYLMV